MYTTGRRAQHDDGSERSLSEPAFYQRMVQRMVTCAVPVVVMIAFAAGVARAADLFGTITVGGKALRNADLVLKNGREVPGRTNQNGYYSIRNLSAGEYTLTIKLSDGTSRPVRVRVFPQNTEKNINLP
jgi:hypothetical protein